MNKQFIKTTVAEALLELKQLHAHHYPDCEGGCPAEQSIRDLQTVVNMLSEEKDIVDVAYWDSDVYREEKSTEPKPFKMQINDQRANTGQLFVDLTGPTFESDNLDDTMLMTLEVQHLPGTEVEKQCLHLHFDDSRLAVSFFKLGNKIVLRPETDVLIERYDLPGGELGYILNGGDDVHNKQYQFSIAELDLLQSSVNDGRGISCVQQIIAELRRDNKSAAAAIAKNEWDKISSYPEIAERIKALGLVRYDAYVTKR